MKSITSRSNPLVASFKTLADSPDPEGIRLLVDGAHLVQEARASGLEFEAVAVTSSSLAAKMEIAHLAQSLETDGQPIVEVSDSVLRAMSPARTPSGIVAIARRQHTTRTAASHSAGFTMIAADVQDPGNLGALLRVAEAGGVEHVVVCGSSAHPFGWKALRGSMGSAFRLHVSQSSSVAAAVDRFTASHTRMIGAVPRGGLEPDEVDWTGRVALLLGGEGAGLDDDVLRRCERHVTIPMTAPVESLNVSTAAAILIYAARRQRIAAAPLRESAGSITRR